MTTYKDKVSGEKLYVDEKSLGNFYYKDKGKNIRHRVDGPAMEWYDGGSRWLQNGKVHRMDGPAIIWPSSTKEWWIDGECITRIMGEYFGPQILQHNLAVIK